VEAGGEGVKERGGRVAARVVVRPRVDGVAARVRAGAASDGAKAAGGRKGEKGGGAGTADGGAGEAGGGVGAKGGGAGAAAPESRKERTAALRSEAVDSRPLSAAVVRAPSVTRSASTAVASVAGPCRSSAAAAAAAPRSWRPQVSSPSSTLPMHTRRRTKEDAFAILPTAGVGKSVVRASPRGWSGWGGLCGGQGEGL